MNTNSIVPAEKLVIVSSRIRIWSGTIKVSREEDLPEIQGQMPPKEIMSDGRKTLIKPIHFAGMENVRKRIDRSLKDEGFPYVGVGTAISRAKAEAFTKDLTGYEQDFQVALDDLCSHLPDFYQEMIDDAGPSWAEFLSQSRLTEDQVRRRCKFGMAIYRMAAPDVDDAMGLYGATMDEALPSMLASVRKDAYKILDRVRGKTKMLQSQRQAVVKLVDKLKAFAFLDPRVGPTATGLRSVLDRLPQAKTLGEGDAAITVSVLQQLTHPRDILEHGTGVVDAIRSQQTYQLDLSDPHPGADQEEPDTTDDVEADAPAAVPAHQPQPPASAGFTMGM